MIWRPYLALLLGVLAILLFAWSGVQVRAESCAGQWMTASWYGLETCRKGKPCLTASGEHFDGSSLTAAHRSLPFGTKVRVAHGGRSVVVRVNDRGPYVHGRQLDLSRTAAAKIGIIGAGVARVCVERV